MFGSFGSAFGAGFGSFGSGVSVSLKDQATFDGVADEITAGTQTTPASDTITVIFKPDDESDRGCLYSMGSLGGAYGFSVTWDGNSDRIFTRMNGGSSNNIVTSNNSAPADGTVYKVVFSYDSSAGTQSVVLYNNSTGATIATVNETSLPANNFSNGQSRQLKIGEDQSGLDDYLGDIRFVESSLVKYEFKADVGTTTVVDTSGNGNNGTVSVGSGGLATFWSKYVG